MEHYEQLRAHALAGEPSGWRLGLALLQRRGTATWLRAGRSIAVPVQRPPLSMPAGGDKVVSILPPWPSLPRVGDQR